MGISRRGWLRNLELGPRIRITKTFASFAMSPTCILWLSQWGYLLVRIISSHIPVFILKTHQKLWRRSLRHCEQAFSISCLGWEEKEEDAWYLKKTGFGILAGCSASWKKGLARMMGKSNKWLEYQESGEDAPTLSPIFHGLKCKVLHVNINVCSVNNSLQVQGAKHL